jgi:hypothetical protein
LPGGLNAQLFNVPGKALYFESENPALDTEIGANVSVEHPRLIASLGSKTWMKENSTWPKMVPLSTSPSASLPS